MNKMKTIHSNKMDTNQIQSWVILSPNHRLRDKTKIKARENKVIPWEKVVFLTYLRKKAQLFKIMSYSKKFITYNSSSITTSKK